MNGLGVGCGSVRFNLGSLYDAMMAETMDARVITCEMCDARGEYMRRVFEATRPYLGDLWEELQDAARYEVAMVVPPMTEGHRFVSKETEPEKENHEHQQVKCVPPLTLYAQWPTIGPRGIPTDQVLVPLYWDRRVRCFLAPKSRIWFVLQVYDKVRRAHHAVLFCGDRSAKPHSINLSLKSDGTQGPPNRLHMRIADVRRASPWLHGWCRDHQVFRNKGGTALFYRFTWAAMGEFLGFYFREGRQEQVEVHHHGGKLHGCPWSTSPLLASVHVELERLKATDDLNLGRGGDLEGPWAQDERPGDTKNTPLGEPFSLEMRARLRHFKMLDAL